MGEIVMKYWVVCLILSLKMIVERENKDYDKEGKNEELSIWFQNAH